jgi:AcrR family transcriptional regulator
VSAVPRGRLAATERRAALLDTACRCFSKGSYRGATTAEIAREAGVSEPILYRHFESKRDLYLACIGEAWQRLRSRWEAVIEQDPDPSTWLSGMGSAFFELKEQKIVLSNFWVQALSHASDDPEIRKYLRRHLHEVHDFVADVIRRAQDAGAVPAERDAGAEAWIFLSLGLLGAIGRRLGGLVEDDFDRIRASRRLWLTGQP